MNEPGNTFTHIYSTAYEPLNWVFLKDKTGELQISIKSEYLK
jgi:hypothetical protein